MCRVPVPSTALPSLAEMHCDFEDRFLPVVEKLARRAFWELRCPAKRADAEQDARLHAWVSYQYLAERGRIGDVSPWAVARIAVRRARCGRSLHGSGRRGRRGRKEDAYDWECQTRRGYRLERGHDVDRAGPLHPRYLTPANQACFRLDFSAWLGTRSPREIAVIDRLAQGDHPSQAARATGVPPSWVCKRQVAWRRSWRRFVGA